MVIAVNPTRAPTLVPTVQITGKTLRGKDQMRARAKIKPNACAADRVLRTSHQLDLWLRRLNNLSFAYLPVHEQVSPLHARHPPQAMRPRGAQPVRNMAPLLRIASCCSGLSCRRAYGSAAPISFLAPALVDVPYLNTSGPSFVSPARLAGSPTILPTSGPSTVPTKAPSTAPTAPTVGPSPAPTAPSIAPTRQPTKVCIAGALINLKTDQCGGSC
jgi:hypothetical protein